MLLRNILLGAGVLAIVLGIGLGVFLMVRPAAVHPGSVVAPKVSVLAAARPIKPGDLLREGDVMWRPIEAGAAPPGSQIKGQVSEFTLVGAVARQTYAPGDLIRTGGYFGANERGFLAAVLSPGDRAVTITVSPAQSASGMILPDDRVDVIMVRGAGNSSDPEAKNASFAQTLLRDVRVVAVGRTFQRGSMPTAIEIVSSPTSKPAKLAVTPNTPLPDTLTLELSQHDAERLYVALEIGTVALSLRSLASGATTSADGSTVAIVADAPVWASDIAPLSAAQARTAAAPSPQAVPDRPGGAARAQTSGVRRGSIRIIRATEAPGP